MESIIKIFALFVCTMIGSFGYNLMPSKSKYFELIVDRFEVDFEDKRFLEIQIKIRKVNKTRSYVGLVALYQSLGNDFLIEMKVLKKQGGEYRYLPFKSPPTPLCKYCANDVYCYPIISKNSDLPEDIENNCPLVAKNYTIHGYACDEEAMPKFLGSGDYAAEMIIHNNGKVVSIYRFYGSINNL